MRKQCGQTDTYEEQKLLKNNLPRKIKSHRHVIFLGPVLLFLEIQSPLPPPNKKKIMRKKMLSHDYVSLLWVYPAPYMQLWNSHY